MTSEISTQLPASKDMTMGNTFREEHVPLPTPTQYMTDILDRTSQVAHHFRNIHIIKIYETEIL